jgi:DNA invertase Pin-like site-specific DNA recombinase
MGIVQFKLLTKFDFMVSLAMRRGCLVYCVSDQAEVQRLTDLAQSHGWTVTQTLSEQCSTAPDRRAGLAAIRRMLAKGEVQALVVPSLAMLGGSLDEIVETVSKFASAEVHLITDAESIDTTMAEGRARLAGIATLGGVQRTLRQQKARAGQLRAKEAGVRFGRPTISDTTMKSVRAALEAGHGVRPTARRMGISPARVAAEKQAMRVAETAGSGCLPKRQLECSERLPR